VLERLGHQERMVLEQVVVLLRGCELLEQL
jgi:hypothetical protein